MATTNVTVLQSVVQLNMLSYATLIAVIQNRLLYISGGDIAFLTQTAENTLWPVE